MITVFKKAWSPVTAPIYALLEGLVLGGLSAVFELRYPGIAMEAVGLTFGTLFVMLLAYESGLIKVTQKFRMGVIAATGGISLFYLLEMVLGFFRINSSHRQWRQAPSASASASFVVAIAALNLVLDFDFVEQGVASAHPNTWSGTPPSASWSRWCGSTSKSWPALQNAQPKLKRQFAELVRSSSS